MGAVGKVAAKHKAAEGAAAGLLHRKRELASVVEILGGKFGGLIGQLGHLISLLFSGSIAAVGLGAALGAITLLQSAWRSFAEEIERARAALEKFKLAQDKVMLAQRVPAEVIQKSLSELATYTPQGF